jgi:hypothetical protein
MRELTSVVLEMDRQGKRLHGLLRVGRLNTMTWDEFQEMVATVDRLGVNMTDFNVLHFGLSRFRRRKKASKATAKAQSQSAKERKALAS